MDQTVESLIEKSTIWKEEKSMLRSILLACKLEESIKWGQPCYSFNNKNIIIIAAFKTHCDLGFFNGALLKDKNKILEKAGTNTQASRQMRFTSVNDIVLQKNIIKSYIKEAIEIEAKGIKFESTEASRTIVVEELEVIFKKNKAFQKAFKALTPGRQRAYLIHFSGAKQAETRISRIEKNTAAILAGRGINDCTCGLSKKMPYCDGSHKLAKL
jgi:uncharacterized protein YdeI (YjbR/CyaY-like superfamily)